VIAYVAGTVTALDPGSAVVEVGGIGISVQCTPATIAGLRIGSTANVPTALVVREDSMTLFGFATVDERDVFALLQTASGVGPKVAQAMLAVHDPDSIRRAVADEDLAALMQVSGIGKKGAQRIVLELKDRLGPPIGQRSAAGSGRRSDDAAWRDQVRDALVGLGWSTREAEDAVAAVAADRADVVDLTDEAPDVPALMRAALQTLSRS
jgi:Holliday junction DNA helicase RuvA